MLIDSYSHVFWPHHITNKAGICSFFLSLTVVLGWQQVIPAPLIPALPGQPRLAPLAWKGWQQMQTHGGRQQTCWRLCH